MSCDHDCCDCSRTAACACACGHCADGPSNDCGEFAALPPREDLPSASDLAPVEIDADTTDLLGDGRLVRKMLVRNPAGDEVPASAKVTVHYTGRTPADGAVFDSSVTRGTPFDFELGVGAVIKGWDLGVRGLREGEKCLLTIAPDLAYGPAGSPPAIGPNATLEFEIELISFEETDHEYPMDTAGKIAAADVRRTSGNELFAAKKDRRAVSKYLKGVELLSNIEGASEEEQDTADKLAAALLNNAAAAYLRLGMYADARRRANESVERAASAKAFRRLAQACLKMARPEEAVTVLEKAIQLFENEETLKKDLEKAKLAAKKAAGRVNNFYQGMFKAL